MKIYTKCIDTLENRFYNILTNTFCAANDLGGINRFFLFLYDVYGIFNNKFRRKNENFR